MSGDYKSYYDVDSILSEIEQIPVNFLIDAYKLNWIDSSSIEKNQDLKSGTKVEIPIWLASVFFEQQMVDVLTPLMLGPIMRGHLQADPVVVSMSNNPYFYRIGIKIISQITEKDKKSIIPTILHTYRTRYRQILDKSFNWKSIDFTVFTKTLANEERDLFDYGLTSTRDFEEWRGSGEIKIRPSKTMEDVKGIKRKRNIIAQ